MHMLKDHLEIWVNSCDQLDIAIGGQKFQDAAKKFRQQRGEDGSNGTEYTQPDANSHPQYSPEAFVDAIMDFIVGDNQVNFTSQSYLCEY